MLALQTRYYLLVAMNTDRVVLIAAVGEKRFCKTSLQVGTNCEYYKNQAGMCMQQMYGVIFSITVL